MSNFFLPSLSLSSLHPSSICFIFQSFISFGTCAQEVMKRSPLLSICEKQALSVLKTEASLPWRRPVILQTLLLMMLIPSFKKRWQFELIIDSNCKKSTERFCVPLTSIPSVVTFYVLSVTISQPEKWYWHDKSKKKKKKIPAFRNSA